VVHLSSVAKPAWRTGLKMICPWIESQIRRNFQNERAAA